MTTKGFVFGIIFLLVEACLSSGIYNDCLDTENKITLPKKILETPLLEEWDHTFGGHLSDGGWSVEQTSDGGFIVTGYTMSFGAGNKDVWLIKTDGNGTLMWEKTFGGVSPEEGRSVQQTSDGGFIVTGYTMSFGAGNKDVWLIKTDGNGTLMWEKTFGGTSPDQGRSVQQTSDCGYIITGDTVSFSAGVDDVWLIKIDEMGNKEWDKTFGGISYDEGTSAQQTSDGGYILTGHTMSFDVGNYDFWLIKTDATGTLMWDKTFGGDSTEWGYSVQQTSDGGYILTGDTHSFGAGNYDVWLIKTDATGTLMWEKTFGGAFTDWGYSVRQTTEGGYIITGYTTSFGAGENDVWLIKVGSSVDNPIKVCITGGLGVSASIRNTGAAPLTDIRWSIEVSDGLIFLSGTRTEGIIDKLTVNETITIRSSHLFGIGIVTIIVQAGEISKHAKGLLMGSFMIRVVTEDVKYFQKPLKYIK